MCGGFKFSRNALIGLNITYIFVALLLIGVAAAAKTSNEVSSLPVVGGIVACGVFLLFIAIVGLVGTIKHHQVMLFFYMVVLFSIFVIQFSVACACLAADTNSEVGVLKKAWDHSDDQAKNDIEYNLDCCGFDKTDNRTDICDKASQKPDCANGNGGAKNCPPCVDIITEKVDKAFNASGGLGLFFSFTELLAIFYAHRLRTHLKMQTEIA